MRSDRLRMALRATCLLLILPACLVAGDALPEPLKALLSAPEFRHAHWGLLVVDTKTGDTLYELNAEHLFAPASVTKLYSVAAAFETLGAEHRFETPVYRRGDVSSNGVLMGDLILVATGDLTLGGRTAEGGEIAFVDNDHTYANGGTKGQLTTPDPLAGLDDLARQIAAAGIKRVSGEVLVDDRLFEKAFGSGSGPRQLTPVMLNDNLIDFTITPGAAGEPALVVTRPATACVQIDARVDTVSAEEPLSITLRGGRQGVVLRGKIPAGHKPLLRVHEVPDAVAFARGLFIEALARAGVEVAASPLESPHSELPSRDECARLPVAAKLASAPLSENARLILKVSHNLHASTLPLLLATKHGEKTLEAGLKREREALARLGVDVETISFGGGAGGSSADFVTPRATVQLLRSMASRNDAAAYRRALPIIGVDGTLAEAVSPDSPAKGKVFAKTGTLYWDNLLNSRTLLTSKALAGYITTAKNRELAFALFVNNVHLPAAGDAGKIGKTLGKVCEIIYSAE